MRHQRLKIVGDGELFQVARKQQNPRLPAKREDETDNQRPLEPGNSVGHLILHLTGNLNHFVGGQLGKTGYVRDREREFTESNLPKKEQVLAGLDAAVATFWTSAFVLMNGTTA